MADNKSLASSTLHVVVFPWLAFGHMLPYLELSKSIARRGHRVSFISTPMNIRRLPKPPPDLSRLIDLIALDLPKHQGLREAAESTSDLPPEEVPYLKQAFDGLEQPFANFVKQARPKPDWIVQDFAHHWIPQIAADAGGVPTIYLSITIAGSIVFIGPPSEVGPGASRTTPEQYARPPPWIPFPSKLCFRLHEARKIFAENLTVNISGLSDMERVKAAITGCTAVAVRSCTEVEADWLELAPQILQKPVLPVGLLPPETMGGGGGDDVDQGAEIMQWLDERESRSVVYCAFGSEATLSPERLGELALGLELAGLPFVWALRRAEDLPAGFVDRTKEQGIVAVGWVPQLKIMAHGSIGGFLTHSGWSSVIESILFGHPLVLLPIFADQGLIARVIMEKGVAVEIDRDEEDGDFTKEAVAKALRLAIVDSEGETLRRRAKELMLVFRDKDRQERYVDDFVRYLQDHKARPVHMPA